MHSYNFTDIFVIVKILETLKAYPRGGVSLKLAFYLNDLLYLLNTNCI